MRKLFAILLFACSGMFLSAQSVKTDSLKQLLLQAKEDTIKVNLIIKIIYNTNDYNVDSNKVLLEKAVQLSKKLNYKSGEMKSEYLLSQVLVLSGSYPIALELLLRALEISKRIKAKDWEAVVSDYMGLLYNYLGDYRQCLQYCFQARKIYPTTDDLFFANNSLNIGYAYQKLNKLDSALIYLNECYQQAAKAKPEFRYSGQQLMGHGLQSLGDVWALKNNNDLANTYYRTAINIGKEIDDLDILSSSYLGLAQLFYKRSMFDSAFTYAKAAHASSVGADVKMNAAVLISQLFETKNNNDSAFYYYKMATTAKDSIFNQEKIKQIQHLLFKEQLHQQETEKRQEQY